MSIEEPLKISGVYLFIHQLMNFLPRFNYPYLNSEISKNGIYIMFENGEEYQNYNRIVRIGTHTGIGRLGDRIDDHFVGSNHRNSIFRKHLGRCFLIKDARKDYIEKWDLKIKSVKDRTINISKIDVPLEAEYEIKISDYIQNNFTFSIIPNLINEKKRLRFESALISTLAQSSVRTSSTNWIGNYHPNWKIGNSKLWNLQHLTATQLSDDEIKELIELSIST
jgi:hypothetical protein